MMLSLTSKHFFSSMWIYTLVNFHFKKYRQVYDHYNILYDNTKDLW